MCDSTTITLTTNSTYGIITSPLYPQWEPNKNCARKVVAPTGKFLRVYLNDFNTEQPNEFGV